MSNSISELETNSSNLDQQNNKCSNHNETNNRERSDDSFSCLTIEECEKQFESYENNIDQVTENKDKLSLLRSSIELLNRLEFTNNDTFSGKVLIFLARTLPLFDQSGVNPRSEFNIKQTPRSVTRNLEEIHQKIIARDQQLAQSIEQDIEEGETISDDDDDEEVLNGNSTDANANLTNNLKQKQMKKEDPDRVYEKFWKMQQYFNQINLIYDKKNWFTFQTQLASFVAKMEEPADLNVWKLDCPYMSDSKSLFLMLNDVNMRRCFLVQVLIILQYLEIPVDTRSSDLILEKMQLDWAAKLTKKVYSILEKLPNPETGAKFLGLVQHILEREKMWNRWKNDKCKEPKLPEEDDEMVMMGPTYHKRRKISDELASAKSLDWHVIGSQAMSRLWNMKQNRKLNPPDISTYLNIPAERQSESFKDPNYSFRLMRLLRRNPQFFTQTTSPIQSLEDYLKSFSNPNSS